MAGVPCVLLDVKYDSDVNHAPSRARCGRHAVVETTAERYACSIHAHLALEEDERRPQDHSARARQGRAGELRHTRSLSGGNARATGRREFSACLVLISSIKHVHHIMLRVRDAMPALVAAVEVKRLHAQLMVDRC